MLDFIQSLIGFLPKYIQKVSLKVCNTSVDLLENHFENTSVVDTRLSRDESAQLCVCIHYRDLLPFLIFLRDHSSCRFETLIDIVGVDYPGRVDRFEIVYLLTCLQYNARIFLKCQVGVLSSVSSVTSLFPAAAWLEREIWDLYGVFFSGHPDLRRILTDYGFEGHPLRKDFPISGFVEVRYDEEEKRVLLDSLEISQEFRNFCFSNPWPVLSH
uniref:NADH dehydrogenase subunit 9 n=1 Tax=Goniomonas avonlea TaxID=1255295 RepID=A0A348G6P4_9CRYP|nr:NADH dehydrogenase subunit 9 [Goniomonas avonlea]